MDIIAEVALGKISITNVSKLLNNSRRTIERYLRRYRTDGVRFVVHGNPGRAPANKIPITLKQQVQAIIKTKYYDFNMLHLADMLELFEGIKVKRETLRTWAHEIHHVKRAKHRRSMVRRRRERMEAEGLLLQMGCSSSLSIGRQRSPLTLNKYALSTGRSKVHQPRRGMYRKRIPKNTSISYLQLQQRNVPNYVSITTLYREPTS